MTSPASQPASHQHVRLVLYIHVLWSTVGSNINEFSPVRHPQSRKNSGALRIFALLSLLAFLETVGEKSFEILLNWDFMVLFKMNVWIF